VSTMHTDTLTEWVEGIPADCQFYVTYWHEPGPVFHLWLQRTRIRTLTRHRYRARKARR
jgi:hypothetical protein